MPATNRPASRAPLAADAPVLVTGASGFIGAALVRRLLSEGRRVHVPLRAEASTWRLEELLGHERLTVHRADVLDREALLEAFRKAAPAAVVHLATHGAYEVQDDAREILETNVLGSLNVFEAAIETGVRVLVNAGSSSEYGYQTRPMSEDMLPEPNSFYAVGKVAQSNLCALLARKHDVDAVTFRLFSIYGPWEQPSRLMPTLIRRARAGEPLMMASPDVARDFVYLDDVLDALTGFEALAGLRGEVVNLGSGVQSTLRDVVDAIRDVAGDRSEVRWGGMADRRWDTSCWVADPARAADLLGWRAQHSLRSGLERMSEWMLARQDDYGPATVAR